MKVKRTYRISEEALEIIECRDRTCYATASDFVEALLLKSEQKKEEELQTERLLAELQEIRREIQDLKRNHAETKTAPSEKNRTPLPDFYANM